jgi:hypothetical protein
MASGGVHIAADVGGFGSGGAGHSHSDTLSFTVRRGEEYLLADAGTFTYLSDARWRNWFRGSAAHNTVRVNRRHQGTPGGPFRWLEKPHVVRHAWRTEAGADFLDGEWSAGGVRHRRLWLWRKPDTLFVLDWVAGPAGEHDVEQFWHSAEPLLAHGPRDFQLGGRARLLLTHDAAARTGGEHGWRSPAYGVRLESPVIAAAVRSPLPLLLGAVLFLEGNSEGPLSLHERNGQVVLSAGGAQRLEATFAL